MISTDLLITCSKNNIHDGYNFFFIIGNSMGKPQK